jgi:hypothetical protein
MGAPAGNQNSSKANRLWAETIKRAIAQSDGERLRQIAEKLLDKAAEGDIQAIKEVGDRIDGRPMQQTEISGPDGSAIPMQTIVNFVSPSDSSG